tara:strand:+ start:2064 stop:2195 length:132 start_codon:yes stop_codon:yes gene_type:complete
MVYYLKEINNMAKKQTVKIDPSKVKQSDLKGVFSKVLDKLKSS